MKLLPRWLLLSSLLASVAFGQKFEGLALTPPMGWNTWNTFAGDINEKLVKETAETMIKNGMRDAGYVYINLDDAWLLKQRDPQGNLVADPAKFPSGMKALGDWLHERGFKFGIYNCAGTETCAGYPGGRGHEYQDARTYASWGVDYLKYDWCKHGTANAQETYSTMRDAIRTAGRPMVFSMCEWGENKPWLWAKDVAHLWRTTGDIMDCHSCKQTYSLGWKTILDMQVGLEEHAGPGHWNDPDMLEVGNEGLTFAESRSHFSFWCLLAAPLIAGNDVRKSTPEILAVLTDKEAIAVNQDKLGKQGSRFYVDPSMEIWIKELSNGEWAVIAYNAENEAQDLTVEWNRIYPIKGTYNVRNIWAKTAAGTTKEKLTARVDAHDVLFFRLTPTGTPAAK